MQRKTIGTILTVMALLLMAISTVGVLKNGVWGYWIGVLAGASMGMVGYYMRRYAGTVGTPAR
jgi:hypothetical protein